MSGVSAMTTKKRHKWLPTGNGTQQCDVCGLRRRPRGNGPYDWDYLAVGTHEWKKLDIVPTGCGEF